MNILSALKTVVTNWKTSTAGLLIAGIVILMLAGKLQLQGAIELIGACVSAGFFAAHDGDKGSSKDTPRVDDAVKKIEALPKQND